MGELNKLKSAAMGGQIVDEFFTNVIAEGEKKEKPIVWLIGALAFSPIATAMDIPWIFGDALAANLAARKQQRRLLDLVDERGYQRELCSYTRIHMGVALLPEEEKQPGAPLPWRIPPPDLVIICDAGCSEWNEWGDDVRKRFNVPMITIHVPCVWEGDGKDEVEYTVSQLKEAITFAEDVTHRKFELEKLEKIMEVCEKAQTLRDEGMALCAEAVPSPTTLFDWASALGGVFNVWGQQESVDIYANMKKEIEERIANKIGAVSNEKYRLLWDGMLVWPEFGTMARTLAKHDACLVACNYVWGFFPIRMNPKEALKSVAENFALPWCNRNLEFQTEYALDLARKYKVDGIIAHGHLTCRALCGQQPELIDNLSRELGIPAIVLEADVGDESYYTPAQIETRLQALLEMIDAKRK